MNRRIGLLAGFLVGALGGCQDEQISEEQAELVAMHAESSDAIGAERVYQQVAAEDGSYRVVAGASAVSTYHPRRAVPWALSVVEQMDTARGMVEAMHAAMDHDEHGWCAQGLFERVNPTKDMRWSLLLRWVVKGDTASVDRVEFTGEDLDGVDREARDCYAAAFKGISVPLATVPEHLRKGGFYTQWTTCLRQPDGDEGEDFSVEAADTCWQAYTCDQNTLCGAQLGEAYRVALRLNCWAENVVLYETWVRVFGRGCRVINGPDGAVGADLCEETVTITPLGGGFCRFNQSVELTGPGCCSIGCPPNLPSCRPELSGGHEGHGKH